jgi:hypothetical protein
MRSIKLSAINPMWSGPLQLHNDEYMLLPPRQLLPFMKAGKGLTNTAVTNPTLVDSLLVDDETAHITTFGSAALHLFLESCCDPFLDRQGQRVLEIQVGVPVVRVR